MNYRDFLNSKEWNSVRNVYKNDKNYKCWICGSIKNLNIHHIFYKNDLTDAENLIVLCKNHHTAVHYGKGNKNFQSIRGFGRILQLKKKWERKHKNKLL